MLLQRDESGNIAVEGVTLMMKDKLAANGVIHVIEDVIIQESVKSVLDHLKERRAERLLELVEAAGLMETLDTLTNLTLFAPSERALSGTQPTLNSHLSFSTRVCLTVLISLTMT